MNVRTALLIRLLSLNPRMTRMDAASALGQSERTVTRCLAALTAAGCQFHPPAHIIPVEILQESETICQTFCLARGQNVISINRQWDVSDRPPGPAAGPGGPVARKLQNVRTFNEVKRERKSTGPDLWITRLKTLLGPERTGLFKVLVHQIEPSILEEALVICETQLREGNIVNVAGYLCKIVGYSGRKGGNDGKEDGRVQPAIRKGNK